MRLWERGSWLFLFVIISKTLFAQISVTLDDYCVSPNDMTVISVNVSDISNKGVESFQFDLFFNNLVLSPVDVGLSGTIAEGWGSPFVNDQIPGELRIGAFGLSPLTGSGAFVNVRFKIIGQIGDSSAVKIKNFMFNDGSPEVVTHNGIIVVKKSVQLTVASNTAGMGVNIDGSHYWIPISLRVFTGTSHTIMVDSIQNCGEGVRHVFSAWNDGGNASHVVIIDSAKMNLRVTFLKQFYLKIQSEHGSPIGEGWYDEDSTALFSVSKYDLAADSIRYRFLYWSGDTLTVNLSDSLKMDTSKTVAANFAEEDFVFINYGEGNMGKTVPPCPGLWVEKGNRVNLAAYPDGNYRFLGWSGGAYSSANPLSITINAPLHITANFGNLFPVELAFWKMEEKSGNSVKFHWQTKTEINNYGFYVLRKTRSTEYQNVAFVKGHGSSNTSHDYFFTDTNLASGTYYYRLKQVDFNRVEKLSDAIMTVIQKNDAVNVLKNYPNPFNSNTTLSINLQKDDQVELRIYNLLGQEIYHFRTEKLAKGIHNFNWAGKNNSGERVPQGIYIAKLNTSGLSKYHRLMLIFNK